MKIDLKKNEWAFIINLDTMDVRVELDKNEEITDERFNNVVLSLIVELCFLAVGAWERKELLRMVGEVWDEEEELYAENKCCRSKDSCLVHKEEA